MKTKDKAGTRDKVGIGQMECVVGSLGVGQLGSGGPALLPALGFSDPR